MKKLFLIVISLLLCGYRAQADSIVDDPLNSPMWRYLAEQTFGKDATIQFDKRIQVLAPKNAENNFQVPVRVDASALGEVEEIVLMTDLNPFPIALRFYPYKAKPAFATRVKLNEATVIHAIARTKDGIWHMNGAYVLAEGGGCTAAPQQLASADWADHLLEAQGKIWQRDTSQRLRLQLQHPMDTGLAGDIPVFILENVDFKSTDGTLLARIEPKEPVSENPIFTLDFMDMAGQDIRVEGRDNNANTFKVVMEAQQ